METIHGQNISPSAVQIWPLAASMGIDRLEVIEPIPIPIRQLAQMLHKLSSVHFAECDRAFKPVDRRPDLGFWQNFSASKAQASRQLKNTITASGRDISSWLGRIKRSDSVRAKPDKSLVPDWGASIFDQAAAVFARAVSTASSLTEGLLKPQDEPEASEEGPPAAAAAVNDPIWPAEWDRRIIGLTDRDASGETEAMPGAWATASKAHQVIVCITDSGIDYTHPDLAANMWTNPGEITGNGQDDDGNGVVDDVHGYNAVDNNGDIMDTDSHGTHTAGIVGAVANNGIGITGIAQEVYNL